MVWFKSKQNRAQKKEEDSHKTHPREKKEVLGWQRNIEVIGLGNKYNASNIKVFYIPS